MSRRRLAYNEAPMRYTLGMKQIVTAALLAFGLLAGSLEAASFVFDLRVARDAPPASVRVLRVYKDDAVRLLITSDAAGSVHLHAYRLEAKVSPGVSAELGFKAHAAGRFRVEW